MAITKPYAADADEIISHRYDQGADLWTTPDRRLLKGTPFSAYGSALLLLELGLEPQDPLLKGVAELSFYARARADARFREALAALQGQLVEGMIVPQRMSPKLAGLSFCRKGQPSALATARYQEILANLERG